MKPWTQIVRDYIQSFASSKIKQPAVPKTNAAQSAKEAYLKMFLERQNRILDAFGGGEFRRKDVEELLQCKKGIALRVISTMKKETMIVVSKEIDQVIWYRKKGGKQ